MQISLPAVVFMQPLMKNENVTKKDGTNCNLDQSGFKNGLRQEGQSD